MLNQNNNSLDFSKWFTYNNQDLDNVHNSADEIKELNDERFSQYLWVKISKEPVSKEDWNKFANWLTDSQTDIVLNLMNQWVSKNAIMAYVPLADNYKNPTSWVWVWLFEKRTESREGKNLGNTKSSALNKTLKTLWWITWWAEIAWRLSLWVWNYQLNKTLDKYLPEDVSRSVRYTKYEEVPKILNEKLKETEEQIKKAESRLIKAQWKKLVKWEVNEEITNNMKDLYARRDSLKETISAMEETKKNLPSEKPETAREAAKKMNLWWDDVKAAGKAATEKSVYYTTEIAPIYKQIDTKFSIPDIIWELKKEDFSWITEWEWKKLKELINEEIEAYWDYKNISIEDLHKKLDDFDLSKSALRWEESKWITAQFKDAVYTKINNLIDETVEREMPWLNFKEKKLHYNNMWNVEKKLKEYAVSWWKRKLDQWLVWTVKDSVRSTNIRRWLWTTARNIWETITPTKRIYWRIKNIANKIKNSSTIKKAAESPVVKEVIESKKFTQPKLFWWDPIWTIQLLELWWEIWDSLLWWNTQLWEVSKSLWEIPWVQAMKDLEELSDAAYQWNLIREEDKPMYIKEIIDWEFWTDIDLETAKKYYEEIKSNWSVYIPKMTRA